jgi:hypothetical protein
MREAMKTNHKLSLAVLNRWKFKGLTVCGIALLSFAAGALSTARVGASEPSEGRYQSRLRASRLSRCARQNAGVGGTVSRHPSKILAKHNLNVVGYWVSENAPTSDDAFIWLLADASREEAKKNWDVMFAEPAFQEMVKSEQADSLVEKVDVTYMHPTDFSAMK